MFKFFKSYSRYVWALIFLLAATALAVLSVFMLDGKDKDNVSKDVATSSVVSEDTVSDTEPEVSEPIEPEEITSSEETPTPEPKVTVINAYLPYEAQSCEAGSVMNVIISARLESSKVTATFNGQTINLEQQPYALNADGTAPEFVNFTGNFVLPEGNDSNLNLGKVKFYAEYDGHSDTYYSPTITCLRDPQCDRITVVEVVAESAETFHGTTTDDYSDPRNSPLPKGTVDYMVGDVVYDSASGKAYYNLRCGKRVYIDKNNPPSTERYQVTKTYKGELPDTNDISLNAASVKGSHTYITFDTAWKAPFAVSVGPQQYTNPAIRDFTVESVTATYVDIKFYYTATVGGDIALPENPLFSSATVIAQEGGAILRLNLKKTGGFYGWDAYYNSNGQLEFKFLNAKAAVSANNQYGADLAGITVLLDAGHGGRDPGALGLDKNNMPE